LWASSGSAAQIADRVDVRDVGPLLPVDRNEAALVHAHACGLGADPIAVRPPADRHEHAVEDALCGRVRPLEAHAQAGGLGAHLADLGLEMDARITLRDPPLERAHEVGVDAREERWQELDHGHLAAERVVDRGHLEADDPAPDHEQAAGLAVHLERGARVEDARIVGQVWQHGVARARREDRRFERDPARAGRGLHLDVIR
jgi:hypothetical protein